MAGLVSLVMRWRLLGSQSPGGASGIMATLYLLLWRSRTAESVFRAFGTSGAVRRGVLGGEGFRPVVAPERRNIQI